tara:strand:- start:222 stop:587 length:366 start_codon:yes stop_codon:yes gene_type:complete
MHIGKHLILDFYGCKETLLDDYNGLLSIFEESLSLCNATVLRITGNKFEPQGVTLLALLAESHASLHTWPENKYCAMDFYTCGPTAKPEEIIEYLYLKLGANSRLIRTFDRSPKLCIFKEE